MPEEHKWLVPCQEVEIETEWQRQVEAKREAKGLTQGAGTSGPRPKKLGPESWRSNKGQVAAGD